MTALTIETARVFKPLLQPSRYKGAHGGRGSGKSHFFAELAVERCILKPGTRGLCVREIQKSLKESAKRLIEDKIASLGVGAHFDPQTAEIKTPGGGVISFSGMQDHTAESIKSYEGYDFAWVEEANKLSARSLALLRPTIRKPDSELWFNWNPLRKSDPVDALLRGPNAGELNAIVLEANWRDNPWFPAILEEERSYDQRYNADTYANVWEGGYAGVHKGAYYAAGLTQAKREGRIGRVSADPLVEVKAFWDLGVSDSTAIWLVQFVAKEIRVLDYIEGSGQPLSYFVNDLRERGYEKAHCHLPHDGARRDAVHAIKYEDHLKDAGFRVTTIANQGKGAAMIRVTATRRILNQCWFNELTTEGGREALGFYHEKLDEKRGGLGLGPEHDWASNGADAFGMMACAYDPPKIKRDEPERVFVSHGEEQGQTWMGT